MTRTQSAKFTCMAALLCLTGVIVAQAQTFTTIANLPVSLLLLRYSSRERMGIC